MKVVQFSNGTYGIRKLSILGYEYLDFKMPCFWWGLKSRFIDDCQVDLKSVVDYYKKRNDRPVVIKITDKLNPR